MNDYGNMVRQLMTAATPVGDVVPFRQTMPEQTGEIVAPYRGGGSVSQFPAQKSSIPPDVQNAYYGYLRGEVKAPQVQKLAKERGWFLNLRGNHHEIYDPSGRSHELDY